jgi:hypothetical protein
MPFVFDAIQNIVLGSVRFPGAASPMHSKLGSPSASAVTITAPGMQLGAGLWTTCGLPAIAEIVRSAVTIDKNRLYRIIQDVSLSFECDVLISAVR